MGTTKRAGGRAGGASRGRHDVTSHDYEGRPAQQIEHRIGIGIEDQTDRNRSARSENTQLPELGVR
eukprot:14401556-Alexandrium_andersonii.AAC.1